jgi:hypothetical protein
VAEGLLKRWLEGSLRCLIQEFYLPFLSPTMLAARVNQCRRQQHLRLYWWSILIVSKGIANVISLQRASPGQSIRLTLLEHKREHAKTVRQSLLRGQKPWTPPAQQVCRHRYQSASFSKLLRMFRPASLKLGHHSHAHTHRHTCTHTVAVAVARDALLHQTTGPIDAGVLSPRQPYQTSPPGETKKLCPPWLSPKFLLFCTPSEILQGCLLLMQLSALFKTISTSNTLCTVAVVLPNCCALGIFLSQGSAECHTCSSACIIEKHDPGTCPAHDDGPQHPLQITNLPMKGTHSRPVCRTPYKAYVTLYG